MQLAVSYAKDGTILTMFDPAKLRTAQGTLTYVPAKGEQHKLMDLPREFETKPFTELSTLLKVAGGSNPHLEARK